MTSCFRGPNSAKYAMRGSPRPYDFQLTSARTKQPSLFTIGASKQGIAHVHAAECPFGESRSANDDTPPHSRTACLATQQTHTALHGQRVKPGNRASSHRGVSVLAKVGQRMMTRLRILGQLVSPRTKRTPPSTVSLSDQGIAHVHTRNPFWRNLGQRTTTLSTTNSRGFCKAQRAAPDRDSE